MWSRYVHRSDPSVVYEARKVGGYYLIRRPGDTEPLGRLDAAFFEEVYEKEE